MPKPAPDISELAFRAFVRASGLFRNRMEPYFSRFGISAAQWGVLRTLHRAEGEGLDGLRLRDLGLRLLVQPPSVTTIVDRLERTGLVSRQAAAVDQRAKRVSLTSSGRALVNRVLQYHPAQMRAILAGLDDPQQHQLHRLMVRFADHLESLDARNMTAADDHRDGQRESQP